MLPLHGMRHHRTVDGFLPTGEASVPGRIISRSVPDRLGCRTGSGGARSPTMTMTNLADPPNMLPEATVDELIERLIWQTTGAVASNRREALMTWAGLRGPTPTNHEIAAAHHVAQGTVNYYWTAALSRAASTITLTN